MIDRDMEEAASKPVAGSTRAAKETNALEVHDELEILPLSGFVAHDSSHAASPPNCSVVSSRIIQNSPKMLQVL